MNSRTHLLATSLFLFGLLAQESRAQYIYSTDFTTIDGWTVETGCAPSYRWASDATPSPRPYCTAPSFLSPPACLNFNNGVDVGGWGVHGGAAITCGGVTSPVIDLSVASTEAMLKFWISADVEGECYDVVRLKIHPAGGGAPFYDECIIPLLDPGCQWQEYSFPMDPAWGNVQVEFWFRTVDDWFNHGSGPFIDDLRIYSSDCAVPANYCSTSANSSGNTATMGFGGSTSISANDFELRTSGCPTGKPGLYFYGPTQTSTPYGDGTLCVGTGSLGYFRVQPVVITNALGRASLLMDNSSGIHGSGPGKLAIGSTWDFQFWFRDPQGGPAGFSFSDGLEATFCP
jgi:hypothetical protein